MRYEQRFDEVYIWKIMVVLNKNSDELNTREVVTYQYEIMIKIIHSWKYVLLHISAKLGRYIYYVSASWVDISTLCRITNLKYSGLVHAWQPGPGCRHDLQVEM